MHASTFFLLALSLLLAACGQDSQQIDSEEVIPLISVAESGDLVRLDQLLQDHPTIDVRDHCAWTPLMKAALNGHLQVTQSLLRAGARVELTDQGGYSPLMLAASNNHADVVRLLLEHGADINQVEHTNGWTALIWAAKQGHKETVTTLLEHQANTDHTDFSGKTASDWASEGRYQEIVALLEQPDS